MGLILQNGHLVAKAEKTIIAVKMSVFERKTTKAVKANVFPLCSCKSCLTVNWQYRLQDMSINIWLLVRHKKGIAI